MSFCVALYFTILSLGVRMENGQHKCKQIIYEINVNWLPGYFQQYQEVIFFFTPTKISSLTVSQLTAFEIYVWLNLR